MNIAKGNTDQTVAHSFNPVLIAGIIQIVTQGVTACGAFLLIVKIEGIVAVAILVRSAIAGEPQVGAVSADVRRVPRQAKKITVVERKDRCERLVCVHDEALRPLPGREMMWASLQTTQLMYASSAKNQMQPAIFFAATETRTQLQ